MRNAGIVLSVTCMLLGACIARAADTPPKDGATAAATPPAKDDAKKDGSAPTASNAAPPISTIATFEGEYFCIYHDRVYSTGAEICVGKGWSLTCTKGSFAESGKPALAAHWDGLVKAEFCADAAPPVPQ